MGIQRDDWERLPDRLDLVLKLIDQVESARDAVLKKDAPADEAEWMIRSLADLLLQRRQRTRSISRSLLSRTQIAELFVDLGGVERLPRSDRPQFFARITVQSRQFATPPTNA